MSSSIHLNPAHPRTVSVFVYMAAPHRSRADPVTSTVCSRWRPDWGIHTAPTQLIPRLAPQTTSTHLLDNEEMTPAMFDPVLKLELSTITVDDVGVME